MVQVEKTGHVLKANEKHSFSHSTSLTQFTHYNKLIKFDILYMMCEV